MRPAMADAVKDLGFHVPDRDFKPVEIPQWLHECTRHIFISKATEPQTAGELERAIASGAQVVYP